MSNRESASRHRGKRIRRGFTTLVVIAVVVGSAILGQQRLNRADDEVLQAQPSEPGYSARDAELIETGPDGRPLYRLNARTIRQQPENGSVQLEHVRMSYRGENSNQWSLTAAEGTIRENDEHIDLQGDVRVVGVLPGTSDLAQIRSEQLTFDTQSEVVSTAEPVTLLWGTRELHGTGLHASLEDHQVKLESAVHGSFRPH